MPHIGRQRRARQDAGHRPVLQWRAHTAEQCATGQGANDPGMCKGYFTPAGQS